MKKCVTAIILVLLFIVLLVLADCCHARSMPMPIERAPCVGEIDETR